MEICANPQCNISFEARSGNHGKGGKRRIYHSKPCSQAFRNKKKANHGRATSPQRPWAGEEAWLAEASPGEYNNL